MPDGSAEGGGARGGGGVVPDGEGRDREGGAVGDEGEGEGGGRGGGEFVREEEEGGERDHEAEAHLRRAAGVRRRRGGAAQDGGAQDHLGAHQGQQPPGLSHTPTSSFPFSGVNFCFALRELLGRRYYCTTVHSYGCNLYDSIESLFVALWVVLLLIML